MYSVAEIDEKWLENQLMERGIKKVEVTKGRPMIEDCFMDLMVRENLLEDVE